MKLWLLRPIKSNNKAWSLLYDKAFGFVVRAETARKARKIANDNGGDENHYDAAPWLDPKQSRCTQLKAIGKSKLILRDFVAG